MLFTSSSSMKIKQLSCVCVCALVALSSVSNGQISENKTTKHEVEGKTPGYEPTPEQTFTEVPNIPDTENSTLDNDRFNHSSYDEGKVDHENNSTDLNLTEEAKDSGTIGNYSTTNHTGLNSTNVAEKEDKGGNLTILIQHPATPTETSPPEAESKAGSSWGYVILVLILLLVLALCIILLYMRRVSRTYSFDLQRPAPVCTNEPTGTFEPVYLDDLDYQIHSVENEASPDEMNGTVLSNEEKEPNGNEPQSNGPQTPPPSESSPAEKTEPDQAQPDQDLNRDQDQQSPSPILFIEESEDETNANNSSPMVRSSDPFVEINLEEPQQIGTSSSSVQPFSPSIFSSLS